jgi:hypothetical protein
MEPLHKEAKPGTLAWRSLILPAVASALVALGLGMGFSCGRGAAHWALLAAPALAFIGAVGGPEERWGARLRIGLVSTVINLVVIVTLGLTVSWAACSHQEVTPQMPKELS